MNLSAHILDASVRLLDDEKLLC